MVPPCIQGRYDLKIAELVLRGSSELHYLKTILLHELSVSSKLWGYGFACCI